MQNYSINGTDHSFPFYYYQPTFVQLYYEKLNKTAQRPVVLGDNKFGFALPFKISLKPGQQKDISLHLSLLFPLESNTIFRPALEILQRNSLNISILNVIDGTVYVEDLILRLKNINKHLNVILPRKTIMITVKVQNVNHQRVEPLEIKHLNYSYFNNEVNGYVTPILFS